MLTEFGKASRKLRIDRNMIIAKMAEKLGVSASFVSALEIGTKNLTAELVDKYIAILAKSNDDKNSLLEGARETMKSVNIRLNDMDKSKRDIAIKFAREVDSLDSKDIKALQEILSRKEDAINE